MTDVRDEQITLWKRTFPEGSRIFEGKDPWIVWGIVDCNKRASVVMTRLHDNQLRSRWCDYLNRKINDKDNKWTMEPFDPLTLLRGVEGQ